MRELAKEFGLAGWRIWFEILSIADRCGEDVDCTSKGALSRLTSASQTQLRITKGVIKFLISCNCIATVDEQKCISKVVNYWDFHRTEERKPRPPDLPDHPDLTRPIKIALKRKTTTPFPEDFEMTEPLKAWCLGQGVADPTPYFDAFRDHHTAKGSRFIDWTAAFRTWIRNRNRFGANGPARQPEGELSERTQRILRRGL
jgi:hypothetical protein